MILNGCHRCFELTDRKRHSVEERAGVVVICCDGTFLIGYAVIGCLDKHLRLALYSDDGEYTERNIKMRCVIRGTDNKVSVNAAAYRLGNLAAFASTASASAGAIHNFSTKYYRVNSFYNCPLIGMFYSIIKSEKLRRKILTSPSRLTTIRLIIFRRSPFVTFSRAKKSSISSV